MAKLSLDLVVFFKKWELAQNKRVLYQKLIQSNPFNIPHHVRILVLLSKMSPCLLNSWQLKDELENQNLEWTNWSIPLCVDFIDINKAIPKDYFPWPRMDQLINTTVGFCLISFKDAYLGYHQIMIHWWITRSVSG